MGAQTKVGIVLETGLDTDEITATQSNKAQYISSKGLSDTSFMISADRRFLFLVFGPKAGDKFSNVAGSGAEDISFRFTGASLNQDDRTKMHYAKAKINGVANNVFKRDEDTKADTTISVFSGPRSSATILAFHHQTLNAADFARHGKQGVTISGASGTYSYIDTMVYVESAVGAIEQLPIRIIKKD